MFYLACTRFNNTTYAENTNYRNKNNEIAIYGTTLKIRNIYNVGTLIFIVEMNNEQNKIEGIGLIKNLLVYDKRYKIYDNDEYNRYIYKGKYWLSRTQINNVNEKITEIFENILFKGKSHLKCRIGITIITEKLFVHWNYDLQILKNMVKCVFLSYFKYNIDDENIKEVDKVDEEEYFDIIPKKRKRSEKKINMIILKYKNIKI
jgi:hypothetical protein